MSYLPYLLLALTGTGGSAAIAWHLTATTGPRKDNR